MKQAGCQATRILLIHLLFFLYPVSLHESEMFTLLKKAKFARENNVIGLQVCRLMAEFLRFAK